MAHYPDHETYRALYLRYINGRDVGELLSLLQPLEDTRVLDLCGGGGGLTLEAINLGAGTVILADEEPKMVPHGFLEHPKVHVYFGPVRMTLADLMEKGIQFDRIACRQAVNYWLNESTAEMVAEVMTPGGIFAFNTFNVKPSEIPRVLQYELENHTFVEVSWLVEDTVHHLQVRDGLEAHSTSFRWLSPERFRELLDPYFAVTEHRHGKTSLYRCIKK